MEPLIFLTNHAAILEQMGFGVVLPAWWSGKGTKQHLALKAKVRSPKLSGGSGLGLSEILDFQWEIALGDRVIPLKELQELARLKMPLVNVRGQWIHVDPKDIQAAIEFWEKGLSGKGTVRDVIHMALGHSKPPKGFDFAGISADGWIANLLDTLKGNTQFQEKEPDSDFTGMLRPYQTRGFSWLSFLGQWGLGACLADDMGLGKTIQTLAFIQSEWQGDNKKPTLLVCPTSVVGNWKKEAGRFTPNLPVLVHHGSDRKKDEAFKKEAVNHAIVITSFALIIRDYEHLKEIPWRCIVLDEAQNIKNPEAKQSKAVRSLPGDSRIALTGTPVENNVGDLWSIMDFLNPGTIRFSKRFQKQFFHSYPGVPRCRCDGPA